MASSISGARAALFELLAAESELDGVQRTFGPPAAYEEQQVVSLLGLRDSDEDDAALGAQRHEETYELEIALKAHDPAGTAESVDARGFAIADIVRRVVHSNRTLNATVRDARVISQTTVGVQAAEGGGWVIFLSLFVRCRQRIT